MKRIKSDVPKKIPENTKETKSKAKKEPVEEPVKNNLTRVLSIHRAIMSAGGIIHLKELPGKANDIYAKAGRKDNILESKFVAGYVVGTLVAFGLGSVKDGILTVKK